MATRRYGKSHAIYGITQYYLPPRSSDFPAFYPPEAGTRFSDLGGMQGWVDLIEFYSIQNWPSMSARWSTLSRFYVRNNYTVYTNCKHSSSLSMTCLPALRVPHTHFQLALGSIWVAQKKNIGNSRGPILLYIFETQCGYKRNRSLFHC